MKNELLDGIVSILCRHGNPSEYWKHIHAPKLAESIYRLLPPTVDIAAHERRAFVEGASFFSEGTVYQLDAIKAEALKRYPDAALRGTGEGTNE